MLARAANVYRSVDLESAPKTQIVERLFERFTRDLGDARRAIEARDIAAKATALDHAGRIVEELRLALDHTAAPELCKYLESLYHFVGDRIAEANLKLAVAPLDHAQRVMTTVGDAFRGAHESIERSGSAGPRSAAEGRRGESIG